MKITYYQVNAFTGDGFRGNPAGICLLDQWIDDKIMQLIARENNLAETAFVVKHSSDFEIRWFTPDVEVDLCGHATLASGFVLMNIVDKSLDIVSFNSKSGMLSVTRKADKFAIDFPSDIFHSAPILPIYSEAFSRTPVFAFRGKTDYMLVFETEDEIRHMEPRIDLIEKIVARGIIVTAKGNSVDFVSRFFAPQSGIPEDPVTGSAHTTLTPFWAKKLDKEILSAWQLSERGGLLKCVNKGDRVVIEGKAELYISGTIHI
jgi:PhzF family phenazine biosynthesis protein